jgi:hypothetical protein
MADILVGGEVFIGEDETLRHRELLGCPDAKARPRASEGGIGSSF